jgi:PhzF family phenazine biosynthesis protein
MASYRFATLDVFTTQRFKGNQLGLVHVPKDRQLTQEQKLEIAVEFGYSETVFLHDDSSEAEQARRLDIFTTLGELPFAGECCCFLHH